MKNKSKKFLSLFLALIIFSASFTTAVAENAELTTNGTCGNELFWKFDSTTGTLTISGHGKMNNYYSDTLPWVSIKNNISSVIFEGEITSIGNYAFYSFPNLKNITIPSGTTEIGESAFEHCSSLKTISIPSSVEVISHFAFSSCTNLEAFIVDENNKYYCNDENGILFSKDKELLKQYPIGKTDKTYNILYPVKRIASGAFADSKLETVTFAVGLDAINDKAFDRCYNLKELYMKSRISRIGHSAFFGCENLENIYYTGTQYKWNNIKTETNNTCLLVANIHYSYCCEEHTLSDWIIYNGSCETKEREKRYCLFCEETETQLTGNIIEHNLTNWEVLVEPTCTTTGEEFRYCPNCNLDEYRRIDALDHNYIPETTPPTCTESGYTTFTCSGCADAYIDNNISASGHKPSNVITENYVSPTCTQTGCVTYVTFCSVCEIELIRETQTLGTIDCSDMDSNGYCDHCNKELNVTNDSTNSGTLSFWQELINFILKLLELLISI